MHWLIFKVKAKIKAIVAMLPSGKIEFLWERLFLKGIVPEEDWLNWVIKVTAK